MSEKTNQSMCRVLLQVKINSICVILVLMALVSMSNAFGAIYPTNLKYFKLVQTPSFQGDQILFIKFDREIYKYAGLGFSDVRLFDARENDISRIIKRIDENADFTPVPKYEISVDKENNLTIISVFTDKEPVTAFRLETSVSSIEKPITVQKTVGEQYVDLIQTGIQYLGQDGAEFKNVLVSVEEMRSPEYRIVIDDGDSEPLNIVGVSYSGPQYRLYFQAQGKESYQLFWGDPQVEPPIQDTSSLQRALDTDLPVKQARVGRGFENPRYGEPRGAGSSGDSRSSWLLFPIIAVVLAVMALAFTKLGKQKE